MSIHIRGANGLLQCVLLCSLVCPAMLPLLDHAGGLERSDDAGYMTRATKYYISDSGVFVPAEYQKDKLWAMVFVQNRDAYPGRGLNTDDYYNYREVANSFAIKLDGTTQSSGAVRRVLVELFTATDCVYCPGAEGSLDTIANERFPDEFSMIQWHRALEPGADPYETGASGGQFIKYNVSATPTVMFDGRLGRPGGSASYNSQELIDAYNSQIDRFLVEEPTVTFSGSGSVVGDQLSFNVSFEAIAPMARGNWSFYCYICEDLMKPDDLAMMRHTPRYFYGASVPHLQDGHPVVDLDVPGTFQGLDKERIRGDLNIKWSANDPEDGTGIDIGILYRYENEGWKTLMTDLPNTGSHTWDTMDPRSPDGKYGLRIIATDTDGHSILSNEIAYLTLDNPDNPVIELISPAAGESMSGRPDLTWSATDDEDGTNDLKVKISLSNDTGDTWRILSYNQATGGDFITNQNYYPLNTMLYEDKATYKLRIDVVDKEDMTAFVISDVFEIYNNDPPFVTIRSPTKGSTITGTLDIGWSVADQEDTPSSIWANISVGKAGTAAPLILFQGLLDDGMANKTFPTSELLGDGAYTLRFFVEDSRGLNASEERSFNVYDPDAPVISSITGPLSLDDIRDDVVAISWEASDPDAGESMDFSVYRSPAAEENWTLVQSGITAQNCEVSLLGLPEGYYLIKVVAEDSSAHGLTAEMEFGPLYYNAPDAPSVHFTYPSMSFNGTIEFDINDSTPYVLTLTWEGSDQDGDNVTYSLDYMEAGSLMWKPLKLGTTDTSFAWNVTGLSTGQYSLRLICVDDSVKTLPSTAIVGPFRLVLPEPQADDDIIIDDDITDDDDSGGLDLTLLLIIGLVSVVVMMIIAVLVILVISRKGKATISGKPIPSQADVDLTVPDFDRRVQPMRSRPIMPPQPVNAPPYQEPASDIGGTLPVQQPPQAPPPVISGNVKWEEEAPAQEAAPPPQDGQAPHPMQIMAPLPPPPEI